MTPIACAPRSKPRRAFVAVVFTTLAIVLPASRAAQSEADRAGFTDRYCSSCHNDVDREGGLDLTALTFAPDDPATFTTWVKVHDRVQAGEMPPKGKKRPAAADTAAFLRGLGGELTRVEQASTTKDGRSTRRRLNRNEYENALRDLLSAPWLQVKSRLPEDGEAHLFNKISDALDVSHVHMSRYVSAADEGLRQVLRNRFERPASTVRRAYARNERGFTNLFKGVIDGNPSPDRRAFPLLGLEPQPDVRTLVAPLTVGDADPEKRELEAVGWVHGSYEFPMFRWAGFTTPVAGRYRVRFSGYTIWLGSYGFRHATVGTGKDKKLIERPRRWYHANSDIIEPGRRAEPITIYAQLRGGNSRRLGAFDFTPQPSVQELEVQLHVGETFMTDASRLFRSRPTGNTREWGYTNRLAQKDGAPGVAFRWMEIEGPLDDEATLAGYRLMFGDLPVRRVGPELPPPEPPQRGRGGRGAPPPPPELEVVPNNPAADADRLLRGFMARAYRRPVEEKDVQRFLALIHRQMAATNFTNALIAGYTAVLSSPEFVTLQEKPGPLDDHALATRLALFLWNSEPDAALRALAARGELRRPSVLRAETERMLADPKSRRFVEAFLDYWLEVRKMADTTPSTSLYPDYYLDDLLTESALDETQMFFTALIREDLPARNVVDSDFTYANERLAAHYQLKGVQGVAMRRVALPARSPRGGLMTQTSVLKVTANGTTTSPVVRGKWIMERIAGMALPPPPAAVPAVEPDVRGAVTIREQLEKHRADESCAVCHRKIDPAGFALENFDVLGGWRERYRGVTPDAEPAVGFGMDGWPFLFHFTQEVDASGQLADGRAFGDVREFKRVLLEDEAQIARNLTRHLAVYATGAPVRFSDRAVIEEILRQTKARSYGVRSIIAEIVQSELFRNK